MAILQEQQVDAFFSTFPQVRLGGANRSISGSEKRLSDFSHPPLAPSPGSEGRGQLQRGASPGPSRHGGCAPPWALLACAPGAGSGGGWRAWSGPRPGQDTACLQSYPFLVALPNCGHSDHNTRTKRNGACSRARLTWGRTGALTHSGPGAQPPSCSLLC